MNGCLKGLFRLALVAAALVVALVAWWFREPLLRSASRWLGPHSTKLPPVADTAVGAPTPKALSSSQTKVERLKLDAGPDSVVLSPNEIAAMIGSGIDWSVRKSFDIGQEDAKLRDRYGRNLLGQSLLLARRLVEGGVNFVTVFDGERNGQDANWDLRNYHFYNAWAFLHGRLGWDLAPAQMQTFLNPLLDLPFYWMVAADWHPRLIAFVLAVPAGVGAFFLFKILLLLFPAVGGEANRRSPLLVDAAGAPHVRAPQQAGVGVERLGDTRVVAWCAQVDRPARLLAGGPQLGGRDVGGRARRRVDSPKPRH